MRAWELVLLAASSLSLCAALPTDLKDFFLVTTTQADPSVNASDLKAVSATSLFDPYHQPNFLLRLTGPGYNSLPNFTLTDGTLSTISTGPFGTGTYLYNSTTVVAGKELQFLAAEQPAGNLALDGGYLLTVGGEKEGWTICDGDFGNEVLFWKGNGTGCAATYVHAVTKAPY